MLAGPARNRDTVESCRDRGGDARDGARAPVRGLDRATRIRRDRECLGTSLGLCVVPGETRGRRAPRVERRRVRRGWHGNRGRRRVLSAAYASGESSARAWIGLGMISLIATAGIWRIFGSDKDPTTKEGQQLTARRWRWDIDSLRLVLCFGASGFGYIIPATFLPVMARQLIPDPLVFGWSWPLFGAAAAVSPLATAGWVRIVGNRRLWVLSHLVMAVGVAIPVWWSAIGGLMIAALLIGAAFMVNALASMQEA